MILSRAPVRLSMGGGGTDLPSYYEKFGGFLMAAAINRYIYLMVNKRFYPSIRLSYSKTEIIDDVDKIEHPIFREALKMSGIKSQIELVSVADVPAQCGLGSSSVFTVALLNGLYGYIKKAINADELAEHANHLEMVLLKQPIGKQDHYAAAYGGFRAYTFEKDGRVFSEPVVISGEKLSDLQHKLILFYMGKERPASQVLSVQNQKSLEGDPQVLERLHKIKEIGLRTRKVFECGPLDEFGEILHEHWITKKKLSASITDAHIEEAYAAALKNGATGGKIVGAGGGGFLMVYCPNSKTKLVEEMAKLGLHPMWFSFETDGAQIVYRK